MFITYFQVNELEMEIAWFFLQQWSRQIYQKNHFIYFWFKESFNRESPERKLSVGDE